MHALIENGLVKQYPYGIAQLKKANPDVSFPKKETDDLLLSFNVHRVFNSTPPMSDKDVEQIKQNMAIVANEIDGLENKQRNEQKEEHLQNLKASYESNAQILKDLPAPYILMQSVLEEGTPVFDTEANRWTQVWSVRDMSAYEITNRNNAKADEVRAKRNELLAACDWTQVLDAPVDKEAWANYRQALRDLPDQAGFPWEVEYPQTPTSV